MDIYWSPHPAVWAPWNDINLPTMWQILQILHDNNLVSQEMDTYNFVWYENEYN